jgi:hypothetical protein
MSGVLDVFFVLSSFIVCSCPADIHHLSIQTTNTDTIPFPHVSHQSSHRIPPTITITITPPITNHIQRYDVIASLNEARYRLLALKSFVLPYPNLCRPIENCRQMHRHHDQLPPHFHQSQHQPSLPFPPSTTASFTNCRP